MRSAWLQAVWQDPLPPAWLRALSVIYARLQARDAQQRLARQQRLPVPVIVVGNLTVGGTGKTPCVIALVEMLRQRGHRPGVLSRGYGGRGPYPRLLHAATDPTDGGDEPVLIAARFSGAVPVAVAPDRYRAGRALLDAHPEVDVLVCDDGLQHRQLARDLELCVVDGRRGFGNRRLLPAGPLREPLSRLQAVDHVLVNGADPAELYAAGLRFDLRGDRLIRLADGASQPLTAWHRRHVHAVAGIGDPERFFAVLRAAGLQVHAHPFADHHAYRVQDLVFGEDLPVLMTEKDAVKCRRLGIDEAWVLPVDAVFSAAGKARLSSALDRLFAE